MIGARRGAVPALLVGLTATSWAGLVGGPAARLLAVAAALAVLAASWWHPAATLAGCLIVATVTIGELGTPQQFGPTSLALTAALLTLYLVLVDTPANEPRHVLVSAGVAAVAISAVTLAAYLPTRPWAAPVGMAAAATALIIAAAGVRRCRVGPGTDRPPSP